MTTAEDVPSCEEESLLRFEEILQLFKAARVHKVSRNKTSYIGIVGGVEAHAFRTNSDDPNAWVIQARSGDFCLGSYRTMQNPFGREASYWVENYPADDRRHPKLNELLSETRDFLEENYGSATD